MFVLDRVISPSLSVAYILDLELHVLRLRLDLPNLLNKLFDIVSSNECRLNPQNVRNVSLNTRNLFNITLHPLEHIFEFSCLSAVGFPTFDVFIRDCRVSRLQCSRQVDLHASHVLFEAIKATDRTLDYNHASDHIGLNLLDHLLELLEHL